MVQKRIGSFEACQYSVVMDPRQYSDLPLASTAQSIFKTKEHSSLFPSTHQWTKCRLIRRVLLPELDDTRQLAEGKDILIIGACPPHLNIRLHYILGT